MGVDQPCIFFKMDVTEQDSIGLSLDGPFPPPYPLLRSSLKSLDHSIRCTFPKLFYKCEITSPFNKWKMLTTWWPWAHFPRPLRAYRLIVIILVTLPCYLIISQMIVHELIRYPVMVLPYLACKNALLKLSREFRVLGGMTHGSPCMVLQ